MDGSTASLRLIDHNKKSLVLGKVSLIHMHIRFHMNSHQEILTVLQAAKRDVGAFEREDLKQMALVIVLCHRSRRKAILGDLMAQAWHRRKLRAHR